MSVHYRFKSTLEYDTITFDGLHISVKDLKNAIIQQKRIGKSTDFDLRITNAQTQEVYEDENALIAKNTSLLIARIPVVAPKQRQWEGYGGNDTPPTKVDDSGPIGKATDLANLDASEDDKIKAMMSQSTQDYDPSNYLKIRGANQVGPVPASYRCYKCHQCGHWIKDCPLGQQTESVEIKKSTGIPQSFMIPVKGPEVPGAMMMSNGTYAVPALDLQALNQKSAPPVQEVKPEIPEDLLCSICSDLLADAVMIPCCGNSFCDECIRSVLLESEDHECPDCHEKGISPATLIPNRFLRKSVANFKNTTGYEKKPIYRPKPEIPKEEPKKEPTPPPVLADSTAPAKEEQKTVISEADSTEPKQEKNVKSSSPKVEEDGPPGVSPGASPLRKARKRSKSRSKSNSRSRSFSPKKRSKKRSRSPGSPGFQRRTPERRRSPKVEEGSRGNGYRHSPNSDSYSGPPSDVRRGGIPMGGPPVGMPPGGFPPGQPPPFHVGAPPPNFRMPPPGGQPPPFMPPGPYAVPPRTVFDPMAGPPGAYGPGYAGRPPRDYGRRGRERTPPGVIDDPLAAFNRILREKDEKRARQQARLAAARRSWSRSRSRSFSRSPPPRSPGRRRRAGSRSPRRRHSRSRSPFTMSRSRSRSFSLSPRGSSPPPPPSMRRSSPPPTAQGRRGAGRFRSPVRSPPPRRRTEREYDRAGSYREKTRTGGMRRDGSRERFYDEREGGRDYERGRTSGRGAPPPQPVQAGGGQVPWPPAVVREPYFPPQDASQPPISYQNRFPTQIHHIQPQTNYTKISVGAVEQPPVPGLESELPPPPNEFEKRRTPERSKEKERDRRTPAKERKRTEGRVRSRTRTPERKREEASGGTPERPRKRRNSEDEKKKHSEDEKRKSKDKKKHKEKRDEKRKKKDKRERHHKGKDKSKKEEFKQVIPKREGDGEESEEMRKKIEERKKKREEEEQRRVQEERKKEERRLRFIEDEKKKREEEARKEEAKKKAIEEARRLLEEEERQKALDAEERKKQEELDFEKHFQEQLKHEEELLPSLYDEVIPQEEHAKEISEIYHPEDGADPDKPLDPNVLELHSDLKLDESDILAPLPEKSKWEEDEEGQLQQSPVDPKEPQLKSNKVSNEVLKRAENVIFARAISSIKPLEAKKGAEEKKEPPQEPKPRISVKQRLGKKVDDPDPSVILLDRRTPSPFNRRRIEVDESRRRERRNAEKHKSQSEKSEKKKSGRDGGKHEEKSKEKRKRAQTPASDSDEPKKRRKDKKEKPKKDKPKKHEEEEEEEDHKKPETEKPKTIDKRKPTLDEANFEPDYDLELHDDETSEIDKETGGSKRETKKSVTEEDSSSSESSSSSSEEERRRRKRKARKKKKKRESSSSESESSSESSDSDRKRKKHKKTKKKKKRARHK
ncbi:E3 ubiquitin-protein ligase RBBP6-like isoform X2 [Anthonomus grandis grandis]|uniref:E3 ubiquitin-protein ligase RBBP6-like isoform X2 n=1 Tax=Anthonomus grandis grandis TaxID=2921223 RepID=UPI002165040B|nr:E3 ubiquitin-protein ligase RBBP6-like isoform X2 [Anthonomus grandis grandis]